MGGYDFDDIPRTICFGPNGYSRICSYCEHLNFSRGLTRPHPDDLAPPIEQQRVNKTGRAFPDGIPEPIWHVRNDHREPWPGDNGIRFEQKPPEEHPASGYEIPDFLRKKAP